MEEIKANSLLFLVSVMSNAACKWPYHSSNAGWVSSFKVWGYLIHQVLKLDSVDKQSA